MSKVQTLKKNPYDFQLRYDDLQVFTIENEGLKDFKFTLCKERSALYPVLVYGTLKRGNYNYDRCKMSDHVFVGSAYSDQKMFDFWSMQGVYPAVVPQDKTSPHKYRVGGDLFLVDEDKLMELDIMEFNYDRVCIPIRMNTNHDNKKVMSSPIFWAWIYMLTPENTKGGLWTQDDKQIKIVDSKNHMKVWGGKWARADRQYVKRSRRSGDDYTFAG